MPETLLLLLLLASTGIATAMTLRFRRAQQRLAEANAAHQAAEARLQTIIEFSPVAIAIATADGRIERLNRRFRELFGYAADELRTIDDWWPRAYPDPDYRAQAQQMTLEMVTTARETGTCAGPRELHIACKDGMDKDIEFHYVELGDLGLWTMTDVSEHYLNEEVARLANEHLLAQLHENQRLQAALQELATRDPLTGLFNRRYLDETLERELARALREGYPVAVMMIDIDFFKRLNDTFGHLAGDEMLRALSGILSAGARAEDVVCRFGGEEFAVVLPKMPMHIAEERAEAWRSAFAALPVKFGEFELNATLSVGIAAFPGHGRNRDQLIDAADHALYQAKEAGRNCIRVATAAAATTG